MAKTVLVADDDRTAREYGFGPESPYRHYYAQLGFKLIRAGRANLFKTDPELPDSSVTTDSMLRAARDRGHAEPGHRRPARLP